MSNSLENKMPNVLEALSNIDKAIAVLEESYNKTNHKNEAAEQDNIKLKTALKTVASRVDNVISRLENLAGD